MSLAGMSALSSALLTKVVGRLAPFQRITVDVMKLLPVTVKVNPGPPATKSPWLMPTKFGTGFPFCTVTVTGALVATFPALSYTLAVRV